MYLRRPRKKWTRAASGATRTTHMDDFVVLRVLRGAIYGHVALVRHRATGGVFAMKIMSLAHMETQRAVSGPHVREDGHAELRVLRRISGSRVFLKDSAVEGGGSGVERDSWSVRPEWGAGGHSERPHDHLLLLHTDFVDERSNARCLVLDYCPYGELYDQLQLTPTKTLGVETARVFFSQIATAVRAIHAQNIAHRDVSLENVLVDADGQCRLGDFGLACEQGATSSGRVGKPFYMAPEVFGWQPGRVYDGLKADIWSLGTVLFIMVTGAPPFEAPNEIDARFRVVKEKGVHELLAMWKLDVKLPCDLRDLLSMMLAIDPEERISIESVWAHPWMRQETHSDGMEVQGLAGDDATREELEEEESEPQEEAESDAVAEVATSKRRHRKKIRITIDDSSFCDGAA